jgi:hypothetical protein
VETVDRIGLYVKEIAACNHISMMPNPLLSTTPNVAVHSTRTVYLVVEESKVKLICPSCLITSFKGTA